MEKTPEGWTRRGGVRRLDGEVGSDMHPSLCRVLQDPSEPLTKGKLKGAGSSTRENEDWGVENPA
jgi:hypothetical protein